VSQREATAAPEARIIPMQRPQLTAEPNGKHSRGPLIQRPGLDWDVWEGDERLETFTIKGEAQAFADAWNRRGQRDRTRLVNFANEAL
jgi:hypothetical protein